MISDGKFRQGKKKISTEKKGMERIESRGSMTRGGVGNGMCTPYIYLTDAALASKIMVRIPDPRFFFSYRIICPKRVDEIKKIARGGVEGRGAWAQLIITSSKSTKNKK